MRQRLEKSALDATRQLHAERLSPAAQASSLGAQPSLAQCVAGLHTIWCTLLLVVYKVLVRRPHIQQLLLRNGTSCTRMVIADLNAVCF